MFTILIIIVFLNSQTVKAEDYQSNQMKTIETNQASEVSEQLSSTFTGKNYIIEITLPYNYDSEKENGFPVLYFPNFWDIGRGGNVFNFYHRFLSYDNFTEIFMDTLIPSMIMVGITITDDELSVANFEDDVIDNPDQYHLFLQEELLPFINQQYNTDTSETILLGWWEVGFFVVDTFFRYPNTPFTKFITYDGDLQPVSRLLNEVPYLFEQEVIFAQRIGEGAEIDVNIVLSANRADFDSYFPLREISRAIYRRGYEKLNLRTNEFDDSGFRSEGRESVNAISQAYNPEMFVKYRIEDEDVYINEEVNFTFVGSEGNRTQMKYLWDFGDGKSSTERSPTHIYANSGGFKANLTISGEYNQSISYVYPATLQIKPGERPIDLESTSLDLQNTEPYKTKEQEVNEVGYSMSWLILVPILMLGRKKLKYRKGT
ncbi:MAG: PKD domain-containing protein [Candidatus Heimdallarchaeota archaeon]|nr:PKD domain-containing protein [Candidatus Heimdallarchaeota archaeon]